MDLIPVLSPSADALGNTELRVLGHKLLPCDTFYKFYNA